MSLRTLLVGVIAALPGTGLACSTCMSGDPTLTVMGLEKPFAGRKRWSLDYSDRGERQGVSGVNQVVVNEQRLTLGVAWNLNDRLTLSARLPLLRKSLTTASLARQQASGAGELELLARFALQPDSRYASKLYGVTAAVRLPTADEQHDSQGDLLSLDAQPGIGATTLQLGGWYSHMAFPWLWHLSGLVHQSSEGDQSIQPGRALTLSTLLQYASSYQLAWQVGLDGRWSEPDEYSGEEDQNSGGTLLHLSPAVVFTIANDWLLQLRYQQPVLDRLHGQHDEDATFSIGVTHDF